MRALRRFRAPLLAVAVSVAFPSLRGTAVAQAPAVRTDISAHVAEAAQRFGIPASWIWAVVRAESAGRVDAVSPAGARGLMQLMPATWAALRERLGLGSDPFDPHDNILAGAAYLRELYDRYGTQGFLAAYNAGPGRYQNWRDRGRPLPVETRSYVARIAPALQSGGSQTTAIAVPPSIAWQQSGLFLSRAHIEIEPTIPGGEPVNPPPRQQPVGGLFVAVSVRSEQ